MSAPKLKIDFEPVEGGQAVFLPLAADAAGGTAQFKLVLRLQIANLEPVAVLIDAIRFSFPGSPIAPVDMKMVSVAIAPGASQFWSNGVITGDSNVIYLNEPAPASVSVAVAALGFQNAAVAGIGLKPYQANQPSGAFLFPFSPADYRQGEYPVTSAQHWANGGAPGTQIYAHDITFHYGGDHLLPGMDGSKNEHYRAWGKPIRAVADGIVIDLTDGVDANPNPGSLPVPAPANVDGNFMLVRHGDVTVLYVHMQKGSLKFGLNAAVSAGAELGLVGNTGNSSEPHTHIECKHFSDSALRPMPFRNTWVVLEDKLNPPDPQGPWVHVTGQGIPFNSVAIWGAESKPAWFAPGLPEIAYNGIGTGDYQTLFDRVTSSGYRPVWVDGYEVKGDAFLNVIFRPADGTSWTARHGLDGGEYQAEFNNQGKAGRRLFNVTSYLDGSTIRYAAIWENTPAPGAATAYHGTPLAQHRTISAQLQKQGLTPINISVVSINGERYYTALWEQIDAGSWDAASMMTPIDYQAYWNKQTSAGRSLAYLSAYQEGGGVRFSAVFQEKVAGAGATSGLHGLNSLAMKTEYDLFRAKGLLTRVLVGYEQNGEHTFASAWRAAPAGTLGAAGGIG